MIEKSPLQFFLLLFFKQTNKQKQSKQTKNIKDLGPVLVSSEARGHAVVTVQKNHNWNHLSNCDVIASNNQIQTKLIR